jgi:very-short-patch-repair endonuclease
MENETLRASPRHLKDNKIRCQFVRGAQSRTKDHSATSKRIVFSCVDKNVLVGVLKSRADLDILLKEHWYRIPVEHLPKRKFKYVAFYLPVSFGTRGKRIEYYARISGKHICKRHELLPEEKKHPRAKNDYLKIEFKKISKLPRPVRNIIPRRISFGFTSLNALLSAGNILILYGVPPTEQIVKRQLDRIGINNKREFTVSKNGRKYRIDLAIISDKSRIAIECDNDKAHKSKNQKIKDRMKDLFLRRQGWHVIRLKERDIIERLDNCVKLIKRALI